MSSRPIWLRELLLLGLAIAVGVVVGRFLFVADDDAARLPTALDNQRAVPDPERIEGIQASWIEGAPPVRGKSGTPPEGAAVFPDGTWLEPINGVEKAPSFPDHPGWTFSPVARVHTEPTTGLQWYIHEGGEVSTIYNVQHEAGGKKWTEPGWVLGQPTKARPVR